MTVVDEAARTEPVAPLSPRAASSLLVTSVLALAGSLVWWMFDVDASYLAFGSAACLIVTLPMVSASGYDLLSPWSLVAVGVYVGGIRSAFVAFGVDGTRTIDELFLLGLDPDFFFWPSLLYIVALALMAAAYSHRQKRPEPTRFGRYLAEYQLGQRVYVVVAACAISGAVAFLLYAQQTGGLNLSELSEKRTTISGIELTEEYQSYGQLRAVNGLSALGFWMLLAYYAHSGVRHSLLSLRGLVLLALFVNAAALPVFSSSRAEVVYLLVVAAAIEMALSKSRTRNRRLVLLAGVAVLVGVAVLTLVRASSQTEIAEKFGTSGLALAAGDAFVFSRTFTDIPTTAQIIQAVPEVLPYEYGQTMTGWLAAPIPRSVWPDKPLISSGPVVGIKVFGNERAGVPPGWVGETYWNFGVPGVLVGSLFLGWLLRRLYDRRAVDLASRSPGAVLVYCVVILRLGGDTLTNGIGYAAFNAVVSLILLYVLLVLAKVPRPPAVWRPTGNGGSVFTPRTDEGSRGRTDGGAIGVHPHIGRS